MKMIPTRKELENQVMDIIISNIDAYGHIEDDIGKTAEEIVDLFMKLTSVSTGEYTDNTNL